MFAKLKIFFVALFTIIIFITAYRICVTSNFIHTRVMTELFPFSGDKKSDEISLKVAFEIVFLISSEDPTITERDFAQTSMKLLNTLSTFDTLDVSNSIDPSKLMSFYASNRYAYRSVNPFLDIAMYDAKRMDRFAINSLYNPYKQSVENELVYDPFQLMRVAIAEVWQGNLRATESGLLYLEYGGKKFFLVRAALKRFLNHSERMKISDVLNFEIEHAKKKGIDIIFTGGPIRAFETTDNSIKDTILTTVGSFLIEILILLMIFRSFKPFFVALTTLLTSLTIGFCMNMVIFGYFHLLVLTFALGACVIGVCFSYIMFLFMFQSSSMRTKFYRMKQTKILLINCIAICTAYLLLSTVDVLIIKQVVIFAVSSIVTTFIIVFIFIGSSDTYDEAPMNWFVSTVDFITLFPKVLGIVVCIPLIGLGIYLYTQINTNNNLDKMLESYPKIAKMDAEVRKIVNGDNFVGWFILEGDSNQNVLEKCESLLSNLTPNERNSVVAICKNIPSIEQQSRNIKDYMEKLPILVNAYANYGFNINVNNIDLKNAQPFDTNDYPNSLLLLVDNDATLIRLNTEDRDTIKKFKNNPNLRLLQQRDLWEKSYNYYNNGLNILLSIIVVLTTVIMFIFNGWKTLRLFLLPYLAALSCGFYFVVYVGGYVSIFTTIACFIFTGLAVGYANTLRFMNISNYQRVFKLLLIITVSTASCFGLMALSHTNIVSSMATLIFSSIIVFAVLSTLINLPFLSKPSKL